MSLSAFLCVVLQAKEDEIGVLKTDTLRLTKMRETIQRKLRSVEEQKGDTEQQKETLKSQIIALERGNCLGLQSLYPPPVLWPVA